MCYNDKIGQGAWKGKNERFEAGNLLHWNTRSFRYPVFEEYCNREIFLVIDK